jgi:hypothetical protein
VPEVRKLTGQQLLNVDSEKEQILLDLFFKGIQETQPA